MLVFNFFHNWFFLYEWFELVESIQGFLFPVDFFMSQS